MTLIDNDENDTNLIVVSNGTGELFNHLSLVHSKSFEKYWNPKQFEQFLNLENSFIIIHKISNKEQCNSIPDFKINGFILVQKVIDIADIITICVEPEKRNQSIAKMMLHKTLNLLRNSGVVSVFLEVASTNTAALSLYKGFEFADLSIRQRYYSDHSDAILMKKNI